MLDLSITECIADPARAAVLLHPLRSRVLEEAGEPSSATEIAARLGETRQKVNYHVRTLAEAGFLRAAEERRRGNLLEQRYVATARSYVLTSEVLGALGADRLAGDGRGHTPGEVVDSLSADHLLALTARAQREIATARRHAAEQGKRLATLSLSADIGFDSAEQRAVFTAALRDAVADVVSRYSSPLPGSGEDAPATPRRPFRLFLGCHPIPAPAAGDTDSIPGDADE